MALAAIRSGWYALPNGDTFFFNYDADGNGSGTVTIAFQPEYRVTSMKRPLYEGLRITLGKTKGPSND